MSFVITADKALLFFAGQITRLMWFRHLIPGGPHAPQVGRVLANRSIRGELSTGGDVQEAAPGPLIRILNKKRND